MDRGGRIDPFGRLKEATEGYTVYDAHYEKLGRVNDLIVDPNDRVLYIGVKMGFFGTNSTIVPVEIVRINDKRRLVEVSEPAESIKHAPHFGGDDTLTPEIENHVRSYFGLEPLRPTPEHEPQGPYVPPDAPTYHDAPATDEPVADVPITAPPTDREASLTPDERVDTVPGERKVREGRPPEPAPENPGEGTGRQERPFESAPEEHQWEPVKTVGDVTIHRVRR